MSLFMQLISKVSGLISQTIKQNTNIIMYMANKYKS